MLSGSANANLAIAKPAPAHTAQRAIKDAIFRQKMLGRTIEVARRNTTPKTRSNVGIVATIALIAALAAVIVSLTVFTTEATSSSPSLPYAPPSSLPGVLLPPPMPPPLPASPFPFDLGVSTPDKASILPTSVVVLAAFVGGLAALMLLALLLIGCAPPADGDAKDGHGAATPKQNI